MGQVRGKHVAPIWLGGAIAALSLGLAAPSAQAAVAYTGQATAGVTTATAYGYVDTQRHRTSWTFAYGTSSKLGSWSKVTIVRGRGSAMMVEAQLGGLKPGTTYHYRLFALPSGPSGRPDWAHASFGRDARFRTMRPRHGRRSG